MLVIFSFAIDTEKNQASVSGNISIDEALQYLQGLAINAKVKEQLEKEKKESVNAVGTDSAAKS